MYLDEARGPEYGSHCDRTAFASSDVLKELGIPEFLAFQEFHPSVTHEANTLGMSGRPGGLGIYFNAQVRNTGIHGVYKMLVAVVKSYSYYLWLNASEI